MKRDFASLTPQEALHVAIFIEERNAEIYAQFAQLFQEFRDPDSLQVAATFRDMEGEERRHGGILQQRYMERYGTRACALTDDDITNLIEVPKLQDGSTFAITRMRATPIPRQKALEVALEAENSALRYYTRLAELTPDEQLRAVYIELATFEDEHVEFLKDKLERMKRAARMNSAGNAS